MNNLLNISININNNNSHWSTIKNILLMYILKYKIILKTIVGKNKLILIIIK